MLLKFSDSFKRTKNDDTPMCKSLHELYRVFVDLHEGVSPTRDQIELMCEISRFKLEYQDIGDKFWDMLFASGWQYSQTTTALITDNCGLIYIHDRELSSEILQVIDGLCANNRLRSPTINGVLVYEHSIVDIPAYVGALAGLGIKVRETNGQQGISEPNIEINERRKLGV